MTGGCVPDPTEVPIIIYSKFALFVMVLEVVSNEGHVLPPHFSSQGLRVNATTILDTIVKLRIKEVAMGRPYMYQQDYSFSHNRPNFFMFMLPPNI